MTAKPKAELMARLRKERREAGLVELRVWLPKPLHPVVKAFIKKLLR